VTNSRARFLEKCSLAAVWLLGAVYVWHVLARGWVPHDEGALAQSAQRILQGELPHRDFTEIYTGGLSYLNALAFRFWGVRLFSLRLMLYGFFLLWLPVLFYAYRQFAGPCLAAGFTLLAVAWSVPNYTGAVPSWYNLFFSTASVVALFQYQRSDRRHWLVLAGGLAGMSCLFKIVGLYLIAGSFFYFLFVEQNRSRPGPNVATGVVSPYSVFVFGATFVFLASLARLLGTRLGGVEVVNFFLPGAAIAAIVVVKEWQTPASASGERFKSLAVVLAPYLLGVALPCASFLLYFWANGALSELWTGVFMKPLVRMMFATKRPVAFFAYIPTLTLAAVLWIAMRSRRRVVGIATVITLAMAVTVLLAPTSQLGYLLSWHALYHAPTFVVCAGAVLLINASRHNAIDAQGTMLAMSVLGTTVLIQFPFAAPIYFAYITPLLFLAVLSLLRAYKGMASPVVLALMGFYLLFAILRVTPAFIYDMGIRSAPDRQTQMLLPARVGLRVTSAEANTYVHLVDELRAHAQGEFIYAGPDAPEVYFLAGFHNPTGTVFDFFDSTSSLSSRMPVLLRDKHVTAIVINTLPAFSRPIPEALLDSFAVMFPHASTVGHFVVRW
jgi:hypothetical protein